MGQTDDLDHLILTRYPHPLAVNYKRLLDEPDMEHRTRTAIHVFEFGLRAVALQVISQYLQQDVDDMPDPGLNQRLSTSFARASDGVWRELLFRTLDAYAEHRERLACPELADLWWGRENKDRRADAEAASLRLIEIRNELSHSLPPRTEEEWREKYEEVHNLLRRVLGFFSFLREYDLMMCRPGEGGRECVFYTGLEPQVIRGQLPRNMPPADYEFYLRRMDGQYLIPLHPLIIYWQPAANDANAMTSGLGASDAALYQSFAGSTVHYLATVIWKKVALRGKDETFQEFLTRIGDVLERIRAVRRREPRLTWRVLQEVTNVVVDDRLGTAADRYDADLYLQREAVRRAFDDFLASDKQALVLLGSSGVGKSCFVLSLVQEYREVDECCILMYDSAAFQGREPIRQVLSRHFNSFLEISTGEGARRIDDIVAEIDGIEGIRDRRVVLIFDAINENSAPGELLQQIRCLVEETRFPWLKVVVTCRPEAWRRLRIRRELWLEPTRCYRVSDAAEHGIHLSDGDRQPASGEDWIHLRQFSLEELPAVYGKYQEVYELQPDYGDLEPNVREIIQDPLALRLVAETWAKSCTPKQLHASELRKKYIEHLKATGRLSPMGLDLLETHLVPLMIRPDDYTNEITADQVHSTVLRGEVDLYDLVHNEELVGGKAINRHFMDLVNADILTLRGSAADYAIGFEYERFYEYFAGQQLYKIVNPPAGQPVERKVAEYAKLGEQSEKKAFLWGALKDALFLELERGSPGEIRELFPALAEQQTGSLRSALLAALLEFAEVSPGTVDDLVSLMLGQASQVKGELEPRALGSGTLAVELAARLRSWEPLKEAALMPSSVMRSLGVTYLYYLWPSDPKQGAKALQTIADRITAHRFGFDGGALEACIGYSLPVLFAHRNEPETVRTIQEVWQGVLAHFPFSLLLRGGGVLGGISRVVLPGMIGVIVRLAGILQSVAPRGESVNAMAELDAFFHGNEHTRKQVERLIPYLDPTHGDLAAEEGTILELVAGRDGIAEVMTWAVLVAHGLREPERMLPFLQKAFVVAVSQSPPTPYTQALISILQNRMYEQDPVDPRWLALAEDWMRQHMLRSRFRMKTRTGVLRKSYLDWYLYNYYRFHNNVDSELAREYMEGYKDGTDPQAMEDFVACMGTLGMELGNPPAVTEAIETFCDLQNPQILPQLVPLLATLRFHDPETVEFFLERSDTPSSFRDQVRSYPPKETVGLLVNRLGAWTIRDTILIQPNPWLMRHFQALLFGIVRSTSANQALRSALGTVASIIYGEDPPPLP
jgi:hypothetical protein